MLQLEGLRFFLAAHLDRVHVAGQDDLAQEHLAVRVVALVETRLHQTDAGVAQDLLFVFLLHLMVGHGLAGLGVHPTGIGLAVLALAVVVLDQAHHPGQLDVALEGEFALRLHLPAGAGAAVGSHLSEAGDDHDLA